VNRFSSDIHEATMHISTMTIRTKDFPVLDQYPFNVPVIRATDTIEFNTPVTLFAGENGSGKSTVLKAIAKKCGITSWKSIERTRCTINRHEEDLHRCIDLSWVGDRVPGSFFSADIFRNFAETLDEWAASDPAMLEYFGGASLLTKSHGQCNMTYFENRYRLRGIYLLDEPESALSPRKQIELANIVMRMSGAGHAQFIIASHSPILLAIPGAVIYSFDGAIVEKIEYENTEYFRLYRDFLTDRKRFLPIRQDKG
jgi:predicted ATPase